MKMILNAFKEVNKNLHYVRHIKNKIKELFYNLWGQIIDLI